MRRTQAQVDVIPATRQTVQPGGQLKNRTGLRVAAYCRVSTDEESQQTSYAAQQAYYRHFIQNRSGWIFAGIYADEGISGTSTARRDSFNRMIQDAKDGRLDYIVTKSISRFARNTLITLNCARELRQMDPPVGIYFEKENLDTLDATGELLLTIMSALAQDESRSISENIRWSIHKKFEAGEPVVNLSRMIGYDKGPNGEWMINEEQARTVRFIFEEFASGKSASWIAKELNDRGWLTVNGCRWQSCSVMIVLRNEKYVGDVEMQKYVTKDFLTHCSSHNNGEAPKYYVRDHHTPIISRETWEAVQTRLSGSWGQGCRSSNVLKQDGESTLAIMPSFRDLSCGVCGKPYKRVTQGSTIPGYTDERSIEATGEDASLYQEQYKFYNPVWSCADRKLPMGEANRCTGPILTETALEQSFMEMLYSLKRDYQEKGEQSVICTLYRKANPERDRKGESSVTQLRISAVNEQISELEREDNGLRTKQLKEELLRERDALERSTGAARHRCFQAFLETLMALPEVNAAGKKLLVNGLDTDGSCFKAADGTAKAKRTKGFKVTQEVLDAAPDLLPFDRKIYETYITSGTVHGDVMRYTTTFGTDLACVGNSRTLTAFIGFRKCREDGTMEFLDERYKVCGAEIRYYRRKR